MNCPRCGGNTRVLKSEPDQEKNYTLRLRKCVNCGETVKTCETRPFCVNCGEKMGQLHTAYVADRVIRMKRCPECDTFVMTEEM